MDPNDLPITKNINIAAIGMLLVAALAYFHIVIPPEIAQAAVTGVLALGSVVIFVMHTFINPPKNKAAMHRLITKALTAARGGAAVLLVGIFVLMGLGLSGCGWNPLQPGQTDIPDAVGTPVADTLIVFTGGQAFYLSNCQSAAPAKFCSDPTTLTKIKAGSHDTVLALSTLVTAVEINPNDSVSINALLTAALNDITGFQSFQNVQKTAMGRKGDLLSTVTIAEQVIAVGLQIYQQIQQQNAAGGVTKAQLDDLLVKAQANDAKIQAL